MFDIVATLGPASFGRAAVLRDAGATSFRLNASHMTPAELASHAARVRDEAPGTPLIVDLQGAKMRLGEFGARELRAGDRVVFALEAGGERMPLPHPELFASLVPGDTLSCDDDRLRFRVVDIGSDQLRAEALRAGLLRPRKGVNVLEHPVGLSDLSDGDVDRLAAASAEGVKRFAFSFMADGQEADWIRRRVPGASVAGKIERREATAGINMIAAAVDSLWICRGDLGAQTGIAFMARWVSSVDPRQLPCDVLMAGQVLEHVTRNTAPTRSEVCHLFDLLKRGYSGFVLADETAIGVDPAGSVRILRDLLRDFSAIGG